MQPTPAPRICSVDGCEAPLRASNTIGRCREHAYIPAAGAVCGVEGCGEVLRKDNRTGYCTPHKRAKSRGPVPKRNFSGRVYPDRTCPDCRVPFTPRSANDERCPDCQHTHRLALRAEREGRNQRDTCSVDGCDAKLRTSNTIGRCSPHRYTVPRDVCAADGCEQPLRKDNGTGFCPEHKYATARAPVRVCAADDCANELRADNQSGYCGPHSWQTATTRASRERFYAILREQSERRRQQRAECSVDGCDRRVRSDNSTGRCNDHIYVPLDLAVCSIDGCENRLRTDNTTGRCAEHYARHWVARTCLADGCERKINADCATGYCSEHRRLSEVVKQLQQDYYQSRKLEFREYARAWRLANADEHRAAASAWAAANPEARQAAHARRRRRVAADMDDTDRLLSVLYRQAIRNDPCWYCGSPVTDHVDHFFPLAKGGTDHFWNLVRACQRDNLSKNAQCGTAYLLRRGRL
jgi:hypothetical protein